MSLLIYLKPDHLGIFFFSLSKGQGFKNKSSTAATGNNYVGDIDVE